MVDGGHTGMREGMWGMGMGGADVSCRRRKRRRHGPSPPVGPKSAGRGGA